MSDNLSYDDIKYMLELNEHLIRECLKQGKLSNLKELMAHRGLLKDELINLLEQQKKVA